MKQFVQKHKWRLVGILVGVVAGYLYWYYIGCSSGSCPIQSHWESSMFYGGLMGYLVADMFKKKEKKVEENGNIQ